MPFMSFMRFMSFLFGRALTTTQKTHAYPIFKKNVRSVFVTEIVWVPMPLSE